MKKHKFLKLLLLILTASFIYTLTNHNKTQSYNLNNYDKKHFQMNRYLFKQTNLYEKNGKYFYKKNRLIKQGYYFSTKRITRKTKHNFLFIPKLNGWIKEVYTSAAPTKNNFTIGAERVDKWYGLAFNYTPIDLIKIPKSFCIFRQIKLREKAAAAFIQLVKAAKKQGIKIYGFSGYRPFSTQRKLYLRRIKIGRGIKQKAVARPGHSEHQLGTTVDVVGKNFNLAARINFKNTIEAKWLKKNCYKFGFVLSYSEDNKIPTGYIFESWHIRYIGISNVNTWKKKHLKY